MKFFNKKVIYDGHKFDSTAEKDRYIILKTLQKSGAISYLELQKEFEIIPKLIREEIKHLKTRDKIVYKTEEQAAKYTCDFYYYDNKEKCWVVEELKSKQTAKLPDYVLRRKLIKRLLKEMNENCPINDKHKFVEIISNPKHKKKKATK